MRPNIGSVRQISVTFSVPQIAKAVGFVSVFLGLQRFALEPFYSLFCLLPFFVALILRKEDIALRNSLLVLALYLSVDQGAGIYQETPSAIRYLIYLSVIGVIVIHLRLSLKAALYFLASLSIWLLLTLLNSELVQYQALFRDTLFLFLLGLVLSGTLESVHSFRLNIQYIAQAMIIALCAELFNIYAVFEYQVHGYLSYDSTKFLLVLPGIYFLNIGRPVLSAVVLFPIVYVLLLYGTRMIPVALMISLLFYLVPRAGSGRRVEMVFLFLLFVALTTMLANLFAVEDFKLVSSLIQASSASSLSGFLVLLDPVRFGELRLLFDRSFLELLAGSGLGVGVIDNAGVMSSVSTFQTAFSEEELRSGVFYGFHDMWVDFGVRFGLIFVCAIYFVLIRFIVTEEHEQCALAILMFVSITCSFFTSSGLILCAFIALALRSSLAHPYPARE